MKKVSLKNEIGGMLEAAQEVYEFRERGELMAERQIKNGNFKASFVSSKEDEESRRLAEEYIRKRAEQVNRQLRHFPASELNKRSDRFQKALAYVSEHRHLVPLLVHVYKRCQGCTVNYWIVAKDYAKKNGGMPPELIDNGDRKKAKEFDICRNEDFYLAVDQVPSFPKAWLS